MGDTRRKKPAAKRPRRGQAVQPKKRSMFRRLFYWTTVLGIWALIGVIGIIGYYGAGLPPIADLKVPRRAPNVVIVDAHGGVLGARGMGHGQDIRVEQLPPYLPQALIAIEDRRFYSHFGVDPIGLSRAMMRNVLTGRLVQGGSTLTQQLAKNLFLEPDRTLGRKVQEAILAVWLEANYSKDEILELYLNRVYFGAGTYGVEAAAQRFFSKPARQVSLAEAALLVGLLKAPSRYAPTANPDLAQDRATLVLNAMVEEGYITPAERQQAIEEPARLASRGGLNGANYVADWVSDILPGFVGQTDVDIIVETTVDGGLQAMAEAALRNVLEEDGQAVNAEQGALVALDGDGAVKALVGGRSYADSQFNRAIKAARQPGSSFKPFIYLTALEHGLTADSVRVDEPVRFGKWAPKNYNDKYAGPVTLREGLTRSINTVAAKLAQEVGVDNVIRTAHRLGISSPLRKDLSIALGTSEVTPLELTTAFVPFANGGYGVLPWVINRVKTADGKSILYERSGSGAGPIIAPHHVAEMNDMLQNALLHGTARRAGFGDMPAAGKTGTTQDWRDAWFVGYTAYMTVGVWIGNDDGTPMNKVSGGTLPAMVWHRFMRDAHEGLPIAALPGGVTTASLPLPQGAIPSGGDAAQPLPPPNNGGFRITADFLKKIFGR